MENHSFELFSLKNKTLLTHFLKKPHPLHKKIRTRTHTFISRVPIYKQPSEKKVLSKIWIRVSPWDGRTDRRTDGRTDATNHPHTQALVVYTPPFSGTMFFIEDSWKLENRSGQLFFEIFWYTHL